MNPATILRLLGCIAALCVIVAPVRAEDAPRPVGLDRSEALRVSQAAVGRQIPDYILLDRESRPVRLAAYRGKPLLVSFIYTGCFEVCPTTTRSLHETVKALEGRFGDRTFNVVSIGFNQPMDSPQAMRAFAAQHRIGRPNWEFLSPPTGIVDRLTEDFGFRYETTPSGFDHVLQVSLLDAEGRIVKQVYGERVAADLLGEPMKHLLAGAPLPPRLQFDDLIDRIRILCTVYDPETGTYRVDYSIIWEAVGGLIFVLAVFFYMLNEWRVRRRLRRAQ